MNINHLALSWSTSRGRDTYGYNIARLDDRATDKRYRTMGGGYDMTGTVFANWLQDVYQARLVAFFEERKSALTASYGGYWKHPEYYGAVKDMDKARVLLDGGCGLESMIRIAEAIGLEVQKEHNRKGHTTGFYIEDKHA